jgi:amino acid permease
MATSNNNSNLVLSTTTTTTTTTDSSVEYDDFHDCVGTPHNASMNTTTQPNNDENDDVNDANEEASSTALIANHNHLPSGMNGEYNSRGYDDDDYDDGHAAMAASTTAPPPDSANTTTSSSSPSSSTSTSTSGSSIPAAIFNFTNCIVGAGCIGLGGAIAESGGFISIALIIFFAYLTKVSLDLIIRLSIQTDGAHGSYENLAQVGLGLPGRFLVMACKFSYSFGCLIAYVIVIKDNVGPALKSLLYGNSDDNNNNNNNNQHPFYDDHDYYNSTTNDNSGIGGWVHYILSENALFTWIVTSIFILPLCLLRDMTPLAFASLVSVASMVVIVVIVIYIFFARPDVRGPPESFYEMWVEVRPVGVLNSLGTFVFTFVSQHTVHLVFASLQPRLRTVQTWKIVSSFSILAATIVSLLVGVFVYMTFGSQTKSDIFQIYPQGWMIDMAKLLLCITMIFTFPLPFFTCRELLIVTIIHPLCGIDVASSGRSNNNNTTATTTTTTDQAVETMVRENRRETMTTRSDMTYDNEDELQLPLLEEGGQDDIIVNRGNRIESDPTVLYPPSGTTRPGGIIGRMGMDTTTTPKNWLLPNDNKQLRLVGHVAVTIKLWIVATGLAIAAPSLGDILDLVGCASGTLIAFVFPAVLSLRMEGYTHQAMFILAVGGAVGTVGTYFSVKQIVRDLGG